MTSAKGEKSQNKCQEKVKKIQDFLENAYFVILN